MNGSRHFSKLIHKRELIHIRLIFIFKAVFDSSHTLNEYICSCYTNFPVNYKRISSGTNPFEDS